MASIIQKLTLQNFGPYKKIELTLDSIQNRNLNVFMGQNSFGKTTLLKSFEYLLYGGEEGNLKNEDNIEDETSVSMIIKKDDRIITLFRSDQSGPAVYINKGNKNIPSDTSFDVEVNHLLPQVVKGFFLFKGEFLSRLFSDYDSIELQKSILKISRIDKIEFIIKSLNQKADQYRTEISRLSKASDGLVNLKWDIDKWKETIRRLSKDMQENELQLKSAKRDLEECNEKIQELTKNKIGISQKISERSNLEQERDRLDNDTQKRIQELKGSFIEQVSDGLLINVLDSFSQLIAQKKDIPPQVEPSYIEDSIKHHTCKVCGEKIHPNKAKKLKLLLEDMIRAKMKMPLYDLSIKSPVTKQLIETNIKEFEIKISEVTKQIQTRKNIQEKIDSISSEVGDVDDFEIKRQESLRSRLEKDIDTFKTETIGFESRKQEFDLQLAKCQQRFDKESQKSLGNQELSFKSNRAQELIEIFEKIYQEVKHGLAQELEKSTQSYYDKIFSDLYSQARYSIKLEDDFKLTVISDKGFDRLKDNKLSTGEYKILSLSFLLALSKYFDFEFPMIIDAPFSDLGTDLRKQLIKSLLNISEEKQIIIFTLPNIEHEIKKQLIDNANHLYELTGPGEVTKVK
jgi:DNA sulfur modification protein DndD